MAEVRKVIIIGSGPAGYAAALYTARAGLAPLVLAGDAAGGQLMLTTEVENFPGFSQGIMGPELMVKMREQAARFGAEIVDTNVTAVDFSKRPFVVSAGDHHFRAQAVILATGAQAQLLGIPGESELMGRGVSTCAVCDAPFYKGKVTFVVGGGDAAMEEALALVKFARSVTLVHRRDGFKASKVMQTRVLEEHADKVRVLWNSEVVRVGGEGKVNSLTIKNNKTGEEKNTPSDGIFVAIGHKPATSLFAGKVALDDKGFVITRLGLSEKGLLLAQNHLKEGLIRYPTMTSVEGVFAAGDVVDFRYKQAITAAGNGTQAALDAEWWLERE